MRELVESVRPELVVWSSLWPDTPEQQIRFELAPDSAGTAVTWTLLSATELDAEEVRRRRKRVDFLLFEQLRNRVYDF